MRSIWLRLYTDLVNSRKVQTLPDATFKFWINLLCIVKESDTDGLIPLSSDLAFMLRLKEGVIKKHLGLLKAARLIDSTPDGDAVHDWSDAQPRSDADPTNAERQRRYREKHNPGSNGNSNGNSNGENNREDNGDGNTHNNADGNTSHNGNSNVPPSALPPERDRAEKSRVEKSAGKGRGEEPPSPFKMRAGGSSSPSAKSAKEILCESFPQLAPRGHV